MLGMLRCCRGLESKCWDGELISNSCRIHDSVVFLWPQQFQINYVGNYNDLEHLKSEHDEFVHDIDESQLDMSLVFLLIY